MFDSKQKTLIGKENNKTSDAFAGGGGIPKNKFVRAGIKAGAKTQALGNKAVKLTTTGNDFVDQFGKITQYRQPRAYAEIAADMSVLWNQNKLLTVCLLFYIRMITRVVSYFNGVESDTSQRGQGLKHEGVFRMIWLHVNAPDTFWKNIALFITIGSWKDVFVMLSYDLQFNGWKNRVLNWDQFGKLLLAGLENPNTVNLVKKYLPQIKSNSQCNTLESQADNMIAKWICSLVFGAKADQYGFYKRYRKLKVSGTAHQWQQLISQGQHKLVNFDTVHGRALAKMVSGKYIINQGLTARYEAWLANKPIAKYTGYVYELLATAKMNRSNLPLKQFQKDTVNKQFLGLVETAKNGMKDGESGYIVVADTSGSMEAEVPGTKVSAYTVAKSMALFFSYLLKGQFQDCYIEFTDSAVMRQWKGATPVDKLWNDNQSYIGGTNFQAAANIFANLLRQGVPESEFPTGIICVSDGCFNSVGTNKTNTAAFLQKLIAAGFSRNYIKNFRIVLWDIPNSFYGGGKPQTAFEDFADTPNLFHISGLDPAAIAFLTGTKAQKTLPHTSEELFLAAMDQETLQMIEI